MLHFAKLSLISQLVAWKNLKELEKGEEEKVRQGVVIEADVFLALSLIFFCEVGSTNQTVKSWEGCLLFSHSKLR